MKRAAGIDYKTTEIEIVCIGGQPSDWKQLEVCRYKIDLPKRDAPILRAIDVANLMPRREGFRPHNIFYGAEAIGIEEPWSAGKVALKSLSVVAGAIVSRLPSDITVITWHPEDWKYAFLQKKKASKEEVAEHCAQLYGDLVSGWSFDATDAMGIAWATASVIE